MMMIRKSGDGIFIMLSPESEADAEIAEYKNALSKLVPIEREDEQISEHN